MVSVPVLSTINVVIRAIASSGFAPLINTPKRAARDNPATNAAGTAKINGHGVATTNTATARIGSPANYHAAVAKATVTARNSIEYLSARRAIGALDFCAASTKRTMPA